MPQGMGKRKRRYVSRAGPVTPSLFDEYSHRWPDASYSIAYAMACVKWWPTARRKVIRWRALILPTGRQVIACYNCPRELLPRL